MKHKVSELESGELDAAVAMAEGRIFDLHPMKPHGVDFVTVVDHEQSGWVSWSPSRLWQDGGPIIERERIRLILGDDEGEPSDWWIAYIVDRDGRETAQQSGPTPLIAAMRAYVTSKLGPEIELP